MRRILMLLTGLLGLLPAAAQDTILLRDAREIRADVTEIDERSIAYRNFGDSLGPVRRIGRAEVVSITYANGEKEVYAAVSATGRGGAASGAGAFASGRAYPYPPVSRSYAVGEFFSEGGVAGIVVHVTDGGRHGLLMSLEGAWLEYGAEVGPIGVERYDGWSNQCALGGFLAAAGLSWDCFPAFAWCSSLGPGWYLPAVGELESLWCFSADGSAPRNMSQMTRVCKEVNRLSREYGGEDSIDWFFRVMGFWSSTELSGESALPLVWVNGNTRNWRESGYPKTNPLNVKAFHRF